MDIGKKSNKVKHFQTIEKKQINGQNTKGEKKRLKVQNNIHTKNSKPSHALKPRKKQA